MAKTLQIRIAERVVRRGFKKTALLRNINFDLHSGELVMILGGSGAGKTTFLNAVMGYEKAKGQIIYGGLDLYRDYEMVRHEIGYVPQQDLLRLKDNVLDTLLNAAEMRMPVAVGPEERFRRAVAVLARLGLEREMDQQVIKLSGGQRKRLSIAVELISDPGLFFLDEPDSGLDGIMARSLHTVLRGIADQGKIVVTITHAPDRVAELYDKVVVLAKSRLDNCGTLVFYGSPAQAFDFFETNSLEGVVRRVNRQDEGGDGLADEYILCYAAGKTMGMAWS
ncbi:MAG: ABC transporter ATP-binding protein [Peptococcaceae bacterium]|jgi:ABC-type multidrug transport system ATPase subunit|nr:ABC transporter ATP-binding protein [Peptococcaceae bacterium]